ncbi:hypothetical protein M5689_009723 [Euphorbia peplus]|nr:hypothetical protein M5689_009723 [Euphorbia peplus]
MTRSKILTGQPIPEWLNMCDNTTDDLGSIGQYASKHTYVGCHLQCPCKIEMGSPLGIHVKSKPLLLLGTSGIHHILSGKRCYPSRIHNIELPDPKIPMFNLRWKQHAKIHWLFHRIKYASKNAKQ